MNDYQPALDQLRERRKGKPGELLLIVGLACVLIAPLVLGIVTSEGAEFDALKAQGVVAQAQITGHSQREEQRTNRKGQVRSYTVHLIALRYDTAAATRYADWRATGQAVPSQYPAMGTAELDVPEPYLATHPVGSARPVAFLRGDAASMELVEQLEYETSTSYFLRYYLAMAALAAAGLAMAVAGWKKRFPQNRAGRR